MEQPLISILMPVKNTAEFLPECLDSILNQTLKEWELIAIDDNSSDGSFTILKNYEKKDSRIKIIKNENNGIITSLRLALKNSKGEFITRMDSDDKMSPDKLKLMHDSLSKKEIGFITIGLVEYFSKNKLGEGYKKYAQWLNTLTLKCENYSEIYRECVIPSPCWMIRKNDLVHCGGFTPDDYPEDYDLCFRFYSNRIKIISVPEILHYWRDHENRSSRNDPNYSDNRFGELKVRHFLNIDYDSEKELFVWGAGNKGKDIVKRLIDKKIKVRWACNNEKKIGKDIYGISMESSNIIFETKSKQVIIAISNPEEIQKIKKKTSADTSEFYFFC